MPKVTIEVADDKMNLLLEVTNLLEIANSNIDLEEVPEWHKQVLQERRNEYKAGKSTLLSWEDVKEELNNPSKSNEL